ncbi:hypothetical protein [Rhodococcus tibetensis]|uniref:Uncharacterized protein n=1 Tax=Rhodococcus tibetensis TaxID=2965064 RepID=A0ABT1Q6K8_9NOCA|nr:hypothetical protein [Rhodococcus sp. FXJ9.536]MCQ4117871.1 hypothetical protein [Rhodococcus sp. FXJ9.536]
MTGPKTQTVPVAATPPKRGSSMSTEEIKARIEAMFAQDEAREDRG